MAYDTLTSVTDDVHDNLAQYHNELVVAVEKVMSAAAHSQYSAVASMTGNVTLVDADLPVRSYSPTAARDLTLPAVAATNHPFYIVNRSATYDITVKNAGGDTITTILAEESRLIFSDGSNDWYAVGGGAAASSTGADTIRTRYIITPSISSNDLVLALKYIDGNDCTSTNKLTFRVGNTEYDLTAAMSFTKADATNWMNCGSAELAGKNVQFFVYAIGETGGSAGLKFGYSRIPYAKTMGDFVNTATDERYIAGNWTNFNTTDAVTLIGRFQAQLSAGAGYTWSIPTANVVNYPIYETDPLEWLPTWTNLTVTSATVVYLYRISRNTIKIWEEVTFGASTSIGGSVSHTLPFARSSIVYGGSTVAPTFLVRFLDASSSPAYAGLGVVRTDSTVVIVSQAISGSYLRQALLSSTIPFTWTTSDQIVAEFEYSI